MELMTYGTKALDVISHGLVNYIRNRWLKSLFNKKSTKTLYDLPMEILDIILQKSYLHWILNSPAKQRDEDVIRSLMSVDVCFYRRIARRRFRNAIWRYLKVFYGKTMKRFAIIRNNRNYLMENITPNNELVSSLLSLKCITPKESQLIQRQRFDRQKNCILLKSTRNLEEKRFSNFIKCLRQTNQNAVASIIENGGGVIKVKTHGEHFASKILHENLENLRNRTKPWSERTDRPKLISQLREEGLEILNSHLDRQTVVVWIWCHSQAALEYMERLYESNQLRDILIEYTHTPCVKMTDVDWNQFKIAFVVCKISINFTQRIDVRKNEKGYVLGLTKLRNKIYILYESVSGDRYIILAVDDRLRKEIKTEEIIYPLDIGSSEKDNCLYVSDSSGQCVWKITRETDDEYTIIKWLTTDYYPETLSVSRDGQVLIPMKSPSILWIYGSDAELVRSVQLPNDIMDLRHAVTTSIGNFIICHRLEKALWSGSNAPEGLMEEDNEIRPRRKKRAITDVVSELTSDGQTVVRRFIPSNATQKLYGPRYLSIDSGNQVFVADSGKGRVILLDSDLSRNRTLLPAEDTGNERVRTRLYYDYDDKQLIVSVLLRKRNVVNVYSVILS